jgi:pantoate--beta-alanine ligase
MGFLHEGHVSLLDAARAADDTVVMSLFVNPLQFGEQHDLDVYPRDRDRDLGLAEAAGVDVVFAPTVEEMYPAAPVTRVVLPDMTERMEGVHRPGHFAGVATVVTKLFAGIQPDRAYMGRKDAQQLAIVTRMTADLSLPVEIVPASTIREADGLALSSRNVRLDTGSRDAAAAISAALLGAADAIEAGERDASALAVRVHDELEAAPDVAPEYVAWANTNDLTEPDVVDGGMFLATAARVGGIRLIDNIHVDASESGLRVDRGVVIGGTSILYDREDD